MEKPPSRRTGGRSERIRTAVLDACLAILNHKGLPGLTVSAVALHSGVHETTIYRRWQTADHLLLETLVDRINEEIPETNTGTFRGDLVAILSAGIRFCKTPLGKALIRVIGSTGADSADLKRRFWSVRREQIRPLLDRAQLRGELSPSIDGELLFQALMGPVFLRLLVTGEALEPDLAERLVDTVLPIPVAKVPGNGETAT